MKKLNLLLVIILLFTSLCSSQTGINYKALIKDDMGNAVVNQSVTVQLAVLEGVAMSTSYSESHVELTDDNGFVSLVIGQGTPLVGTYSGINWAADEHFLNVQVDIGSGLVDMGTTQFFAVPYALSSEDNRWDAGNSHIYNETERVGIGFPDPPGSRLEVHHNSGIQDAQLKLYEDANDYSRLTFQNNQGSFFWTLAALNQPLLENERLNIFNSRSGDLMTIKGDGKIGIGDFSPTQRVDINGKLKIADDNNNPDEGTMRYNQNAQKFEGYTGTQWEEFNKECVTKAVVTNHAYNGFSVDFTINGDNTITIIFDFNIRVDLASFVNGSSFTFVGSAGAATGTFTSINGGKSIRFVTNEPWFNIFPCFTGGATITLKGDGGSIITDLNGNPIDGDLDGLFGGDFVTTIDIVC